jgi:hypothetical protein
MSIIEAVRTKTLHLSTIGVRTWPRLKLGQAVSDAAQAYATALANSYLIALGLEPHARANRERERPRFED